MTTMTHTDPDPRDLVPPILRTWCYGVGTVIELGIAPALLAAGQTVAAAVCAPIGGAVLALAWGYRPTRPAT